MIFKATGNLKSEGCACACAELRRTAMFLRIVGLQCRTVRYGGAPVKTSDSFASFPKRGEAAFIFISCLKRNRRTTKREIRSCPSPSACGNETLRGKKRNGCGAHRPAVRLGTVGRSPSSTTHTSAEPATTILTLNANREKRR